MHLFLIILILILTIYIIILVRRHFESFSQDQDHLIAHFGGTPNNSQIWPDMIKYPPYV